MKKQGFTLTEILITLTIIGVIAALTIPNLMTSVGKSKTETQLLKIESELNQAIQLYENNNGSLASILGNGTLVRDAFATVMLTSYVGTKAVSLKRGNGDVVITGNVNDITLKNGMDLLGFTVNNGVACTGSGAHDCMYITADLDGTTHGSNAAGSDIFRFSIVKNPASGIYSVEPFGASTGHANNPATDAWNVCGGTGSWACAADMLR